MHVRQEAEDGIQNKRDPHSYAVIGACMEVHRVLANGFAEPVYQDALAVELAARGIEFEREKLLNVMYKGTTLSATYRPDFICFGNMIVELKALDRLTGIERSQVINYLKVTGYRVALLINFGARTLEYERFVL